MYGVAVAGHDISSLFNCIFIIKLNAQRALGKLPVMIDADILDAHIVHGKKRSNSGYCPRFVCDVYRECMFCFDRSAGSINEGLSLISCGVEEVVQGVFSAVVETDGDIIQ